MTKDTKARTGVHQEVKIPEFKFFQFGLRQVMLMDGGHISETHVPGLLLQETTMVEGGLRNEGIKSEVL